jgi:hypothetical protein
VYGLAFNQVELTDWVRDIIPLFYMFLPVLWIPMLRQHPQGWAQIIAYVLTLIGTLFAIRFFLIDDVSIRNLGRAVMFGDMNYFPMDPAVTFTAVFALLEGFRAMENRSTKKALFWFMLSAVSIASLAAMMVRAPLILVALIFITRITRLRIKGFFGLSFLAAIILITCTIVLSALPLLELIIEKFQTAGLNTKDTELIELFSFLTSGPMPLMFGTGWGGTFISPAYGMPVRFVHNFAGYFFLKSGAAGFIIAILIIINTYPQLLKKWINPTKHDASNVSPLSSIYPACIAVLSSSYFLQPNFKSLTFGLVLATSMLSIGLFSSRQQKATHPIHTSSNNREDHSNRSDVQ